MELLLLPFIVFFGSLLYIAPGLIASGRQAKWAGSVWVITIFFGWTFIGWVIALALACGEAKEQIALSKTNKPE